MNTRGNASRRRGSGALWRACLILLALAAVLATAAPTRAGSIIRVVPGGAGANTGADWDNAKDLAVALSDASSGDEMWVAAGTYKPTTQTDPNDARTATFTLKYGVEIYGGFAGSETARDQRNWQTNVTTLSGDLKGDDGPNFGNRDDNSYHVVTGSYTDSNAILDGFTVTGGNGDGGGMYNAYGSPTLRNVTFSGNLAAATGGGMDNWYSSPTLTNIVFSDNSAAYGGGMDNGYSRPKLTNVVFSGNSAVYGGGMFNSNGRPKLTNVVFSGNSADKGGGTYNENDSNPTLTNVVFSGNSADNEGGGMYTIASSATLTNVTFSGNSADKGGGMHNVDSSLTIRNSILWGNTAPVGPELHNIIGSTASVSYSIVKGGYSGATDTDPQFVAAVPSAPTTGGNLRLQATSRGIDAGNNADVPSDVTTDLDGAPRTAFNVVDMGAYEAQLKAGLAPSPAANAAGWTNTNVTVTWNWSSGNGSGLDNGHCTPSSTSTGEGTLTLTATCKDQAGYTGSVSYTVKVDKTAPTYVSGKPTTDPNGSNNWFKSPLTVAFTGQDALSGVATCISTDYSGPDGASITLNGTCTDVAGNTSASVASSAFKYDATPPNNVAGGPTIAPNGSNNWFKSALTVAFSGADNLSGVATCTSTPYSGPDGASITLNGTCTDKAGNTSASVASSAFKYDATPPNNVAGRPTTEPNGSNDWFKSPLTVAFSAADNLSGVATCTSTDYSGPDGASITLNGTCSDNAGNTSASVASSAFKYDATPPNNVAGGPTTAANGSNDWFKSPLTVAFSGADNLSGVATCTSADYSGPDGASITLNGTCTDKAGNTSASVASSAFKYDASPPNNVAGGPTTAPNGSNGWFKSPLTVAFSGQDAPSGIATCTSTPYSGPDGASITLNGTCTDNAGNTSALVASSAFKYDATLPTLNPTISPNPPILGGSATATPNAADNLSGVASQSCEGVNTASVGAKTLTCAATDGAGNGNSVVVSYTVGYAIGLVSPTVGPPSVNNVYVMGIGPWYTTAKWKLTNATGTAITPSGTVRSVTYKDMACGGTPYDPPKPAGAYSSSNPRYDTYQRAWLFNWQLPGRNACYALFVTLDSTQVLTFLFNIH